MAVIELSVKIQDYIAKRCEDRLEKVEKEAAKQRSGLATSEEVAGFDAKHAEVLIAEKAKYLPRNWLSDAAKRAKQISLVSHAAKFTHSDVKGSSLLVEAVSSRSHQCLSTSALNEIHMDVVGNAATLDVANMLLLEWEGKRILDYVAANDASPFKSYAENEDQLSEWMQGFSEALKLSEPSSHVLAKQVYFPVDEDDYHILSPLASSAMSHSLYRKIQDSRFGDVVKARRDAKKAKRFAPGIVQDIPDLAIQTFGGTKPQNISLLNSQRRGRTYLLNAEPPTWVGKLQPPQSESHFWLGFIRKVRPIVIDLRNFVLTSKHRESTIEVRAQRQRLIQNLVDELLQYAAGFWQIPEGWSKQDCGLPEYLKAWLDVGNADTRKAVQSDKDAWIKAIGDRFSECVRKELEYKKVTLSDSELKYFRKQIKDESVRMTNELEVML